MVPCNPLGMNLARGRGLGMVTFKGSSPRAAGAGHAVTLRKVRKEPLGPQVAASASSGSRLRGISERWNDLVSG